MRGVDDAGIDIGSEPFIRYPGEQMQNQLHERLERLLSRDEVDPTDFNLVEKEGDTAFDILRTRMETLDAERRARALSLLLSLTRQFCIHRLPDAVRTALLYTTSADRTVRSAAVSVTARGSLVMPAFRQLSSVQPEPPSRDAVRDAISRAMALGIEDPARKEADRFLTWATKM